MADINPHPPEPPRRILIVRLSALGDTVHSLPLAAALKKIHPGCFLGWLVERPSAPLIVGNPLVDWAHVLPKGWLKSPARVWELRRRLARERFDLAFDVQGLAKSAIAAWLSGAKIRVGFTRGEAREIAPILDNRLAAPAGRHVVTATLSLLNAIGAKPPATPEFIFPPCPPDDLQAIKACLADRKYAAGFILLGPWGTVAAKLWPLDRFLELARKLLESTGLPSLMLGHGDSERGAVGEIAAKSGGALAPAPAVGLVGVAEIARRARLFVGCDSFPLHAASAAGCPSLGLFSVSDPLRVGPLGANGDSVYETLTLVGSMRKCRRLGLGLDNMSALGVEKVLGRCLHLLNRHDKE